MIRRLAARQECTAVRAEAGRCKFRARSKDAARVQQATTSHGGDSQGKRAVRTSMGLIRSAEAAVCAQGGGQAGQDRAVHPADLSTDTANERT
jgi:hypothetical protein